MYCIKTTKPDHTGVPLSLTFVVRNC